VIVLDGIAPLVFGFPGGSVGMASATAGLATLGVRRASADADNLICSMMGGSTAPFPPDINPVHSSIRAAVVLATRHAARWCNHSRTSEIRWLLQRAMSVPEANRQCPTGLPVYSTPGLTTRALW
jgi:hypothetical protein